MYYKYVLKLSYKLIEYTHENIMNFIYRSKVNRLKVSKLSLKQKGSNISFNKNYKYFTFIIIFICIRVYFQK